MHTARHYLQFSVFPLSLQNTRGHGPPGLHCAVPSPTAITSSIPTSERRTIYGHSTVKVICMHYYLVSFGTQGSLFQKSELLELLSHFCAFEFTPYLIKKGPKLQDLLNPNSKIVNAQKVAKNFWIAQELLLQFFGLKKPNTPEFAQVLVVTCPKLKLPNYPSH